MRDIGKNIRQLQEDAQLTQEQMAEALHVTRQTVSNYETGRSRPDIDMLMSIADILGTDINVLLYGKPRVPGKNVPRSFWLGLALTLILGISLLFYENALQLMRREYIAAPALFLKVLVMPLFYVFIGWTALQGIGLISGAKPMQKPWTKYLGWAIYSLTIAYFVLMVPAIIHEIKYILVQNYIDKLRESIYSLGLSFSSSFKYSPSWISRIQSEIRLFNYGKEALFIVPGALLWLFGFPQKSDKNYIPLLLGLILTLTLYFGAKEEYVLQVDNPEQYQDLRYGIVVEQLEE